MENEEQSKEKEEDSVEFEDALSGLEEVEAKRRRMGVFLGVGALALLAVSLILIAQFRSALFRPKMPVEESQREIIEKTDDPECRRMISEITNIGNTFFAMEGRIEEHIPGGEPEAVRKVVEDLATIDRRLAEAKELSSKANLRFEKSSKELEDWFEFVDREMEVVRDVAGAELERIEGAEAGGDAGLADAAGAAGDAGDSAERADAGGQKADAGRSPTELRNSVLVQLHTAFENFRVWHSASLHPCGDSDEGETPWRPDDWEADAGQAGESPSK